MSTQELTLHVVVRHEPEDGIFIAEVAELQGCIAMGYTEDELRKNIKSAIADYYEIFEGRTDVAVDDPQEDPVQDVSRRASHVRVLSTC